MVMHVRVFYESLQMGNGIDKFSTSVFIAQADHTIKTSTKFTSQTILRQFFFQNNKRAWHSWAQKKDGCIYF